MLTFALAGRRYVLHSQFRVALLLTAVLSLPAVGATQKKAHKKPKPEPTTIVIAVPEMVPGENSELPITTSCEDARQFYLAAMVDWENLQTEHALEKWRAATEKDRDRISVDLVLRPGSAGGERRSIESQILGHEGHLRRAAFHSMAHRSR